jgi:archaellum component FlaG (FlaF/FlaG flagellin family)
MDTSVGNPRRQDFLVINDEEQTPTVLNPMSGQVFITNRVGKQVLELADGERSVEVIVDAIVKSFVGATPETVRREVHAFLQEGSEKGLVTWAGPTM